MWERFSFYGNKFLLKLYMVNYLLVKSRQLLQGGSERVSGDPSQVWGWDTIHRMLNEPTVGGCASLILGNAAFKPNISTQVGSLYEPGDPRRDGAFTIFYMGINLGAFLATAVCLTLAAVKGWSWAFASAGVGMVVGMIIYGIGGRYLPADNLTRRKLEEKNSSVPIEKKPLTSSEWKVVWALIVIVTLNIVFWMTYEQNTNVVLA